MELKGDGWVSGVRHIPSPNFNTRTNQEDISLLVIHSISLPEGCYGNGNVAALFTNQLDCQQHSSFKSLETLRVSSHFFIGREGGVIQFVSCLNRAWHAGQSVWKGRENCNDYSIGIELEGTDHTPFAEIQYEQLAKLTVLLQQRFPAISLERVVGHEHIAPERKTDPGKCFQWEQYFSQIHKLSK